MIMVANEDFFSLFILGDGNEGGNGARDDDVDYIDARCICNAKEFIWCWSCFLKFRFQFYLCQVAIDD